MQLLFLIEFLIERYLADVDRYTSEWEEQKKRERLEKAERKRRLYFPGKYDRMLWKIIKNEILHQKKAIIFMLCGNVILLGSAFSLYALKTQFQALLQCGSSSSHAGAEWYFNRRFNGNRGFIYFFGSHCFL